MIDFTLPLSGTFYQLSPMGKCVGPVLFSTPARKQRILCHSLFRLSTSSADLITQVRLQRMWLKNLFARTAVYGPTNMAPRRRCNDGVLNFDNVETIAQANRLLESAWCGAALVGYR
ncbi:hypothetical protein O9992_09490 [Vibrio lentus]|nr:hypothetical protein [Vibrio lentus]